MRPNQGSTISPASLKTEKRTSLVCQDTESAIVLGPISIHKKLHKSRRQYYQSCSDWLFTWYLKVLDQELASMKPYIIICWWCTLNKHTFLINLTIICYFIYSKDDFPCSWLILWQGSIRIYCKLMHQLDRFFQYGNPPPQLIHIYIYKLEMDDLCMFSTSAYVVSCRRNIKKEAETIKALRKPGNIQTACSDQTNQLCPNKHQGKLQKKGNLLTQHIQHSYWYLM